MIIPNKPELVNTLCRNNVQFAAIFGSRAKGTVRPDREYENHPDKLTTLADKSATVWADVEFVRQGGALMAHPHDNGVIPG